MLFRSGEMLREVELFPRAMEIQNETDEFTKVVVRSVAGRECSVAWYLRANWSGRRAASFSSDLISFPHPGPRFSQGWLTADVIGRAMAREKARMFMVDQK